MVVLSIAELHACQTKKEMCVYEGVGMQFNFTFINPHFTGSLGVEFKYCGVGGKFLVE